MMKELKLVTRRSGFQAQIGAKVTPNEDRCLECMGLRCDSCRPVYSVDNEQISAPMGRLLTAREGRQKDALLMVDCSQALYHGCVLWCPRSNSAACDHSHYQEENLVVIQC